MIYLSTGANGAGKTLFSLYDCRQLQLKDLRPVYYVEDRFRPLAPLLEEFGWKPFKFEEWQSLPNGSILFCDEVQEDLPKRPTNGVVPDHIKKIAQHRVRGFDFFLQTPHPGNLDKFVMNIIGAPGYHRHFKRVAGAAPTSSELRWDAVNLQCEKHGSGKNAQINMRGFPKEVYSWYESAEVHTGKLKIPKAFIYLVVSLPIIAALFYFAFSMMYKKNVKPTNALEAQGVTAVAGGASGHSSNDRTKPKTTADYVADYRPRLSALLHTAPVYDKLTEPRRVPVPAACVQSVSQGCKCYTQDATPYPVDLAMCQQLVKSGTFLAFLPEGERSERREAIGRGDAALSRSEAVAVPSGLTVIGLPSAGPVLPPVAPPAPEPQRIASVRR